MNLQKILHGAVPALLALGLAACATTHDIPAAGTASPASAGDAVMGDWQGYRVTTSGTVLPLAVQIVSYGENTYEAAVAENFEHRDPDRFVLPLRRTGDAFLTPDDPGFRATLKDGVLSGSSPRGNITSFTLRKVQRMSPTLGAQPPAGALVLFDGKDLSQWKHTTIFAGILDFARVLGGNDRVAYARASVTVPVAQDGLLLVGSDDGVKLWLNGTLVQNHKITRSVTPNEDTVKIRLAAGTNTILAKVNQGDGGWGLCIRVADVAGKPVNGLTSAADAAGYIMHWQIAGPYTAAGKSADALLEEVFAPETSGAANIAWKQEDLGTVERPVSWKIVDGAMEVAGGGGSIVTKKKFTDCDLHLEFRTPYMPGSRGQARGNSGVYMQGRYEIQVLDSYGLNGEDNECGGIYKVAAPRVNMCAPPGQWQTYDINFRAPRYDASGTLTSPPLVTVRHNGVVIHQNLPLPGPTGGALDDRMQDPGGLSLQDHGNPVQYRNIWLVEPGR